MQQLHNRYLQSSQGLSWINEQSNTIQIFKILNESESRDPAKYHIMQVSPCLLRKNSLDKNFGTVIDENIVLYSNKKIYLEAIEMQEVVFLFTPSGPKCLEFYCTYLNALSRLYPPPRILYIQKSTGNVELNVKM